MAPDSFVMYKSRENNMANKRKSQRWRRIARSCRASACTNV
jgi:hypothetical protein